MRIEISGHVEYRPVETVRGDVNSDDPQSVMEWLADARKLIAETAKAIEDHDQYAGAPIGIRVVLDQSRRRIDIIGESEI